MGELEESLFNWLVKRAEDAAKYERATKETAESNVYLVEELKSLVVKVAYNTATTKDRTRLKALEKIILEKLNQKGEKE